jgi:alpha-L-rhamnosidase
MPKKNGPFKLNRRQALVGLGCAAATPLLVDRNSIAEERHGPQSASGEQSFRSGRPIWPEGREKEMNLSVGFRTAFEAPAGKHVYLRVAGSTFYRVYLNGKFHGWGPARGPKGYFRIDHWDITQHLLQRRNYVCVEVAGYNVNSFYVLDQPSFLQAEVITDSEVLASTAGGGRAFEAKILSERVQKVQRYTFQRTFSEVYHLNPGSTRWRESPDDPMKRMNYGVSAPRMYIARRVPFPDYAKRQPQVIAAHGEFQWGANDPKTLEEDRSVPGAARIGPKMLGYAWSDLTEIPYLELQKTRTTVNNRIDTPYNSDQPIELKAGRFKTLDFGSNLSGFFGARVAVTAAAKLYFTFDETLTDGDVDFKRLMCVNVVAYTLAPGIYELETFEPYGLEFLKLMVLEGQCEIDHVYLREYTTPDVWTAAFSCSNQGLNKLFAAGRECYRANAVDLFQDNPTRERAGWLCDSSFTARAAPLLTGFTRAERNQFENYLLPEHFENIPDGVLPMCYPGDQLDGSFVTQWPLWFVIQLEQYLDRSGDAATVAAFRPRVLKLFDYFRPFENSDGLLHDLKGWVFVEWSKSNEYVQPLNFPTNMLYAAALAAAGRLYTLPQFSERAEALRGVIRKQAYDGKFFVDNAVRQDDRLIPSHNRTETCQYYAFYFDVATPATHPDLWKTLVTEFGPKRRTTKAYSDVPPSNAFMGNLLRQELLSRAGLTDQLVGEATANLLYMAEISGTLWENSSNEASMNHAFESNIVVSLYRDILGLYKIDYVHKLVHLRFSNLSLDWCEGRTPTPDGLLSLRWVKTPDALTYQIDVPAGYKVFVENISSSNVVQKHFPLGKVNFGFKVEGGYQ